MQMHSTHWAGVTDPGSKKSLDCPLHPDVGSCEPRDAEECHHTDMERLLGISWNQFYTGIINHNKFPYPAL